MWNENDIEAAHEHIEDLRRAAEKHNAVTRMKTASQGKQPGSSKQPGKQPQNLWERVRNTLR